MTFEVANLEELPMVAEELLSSFPDEKILLFYGHMGAGKTTLINALCQQLGVTDHTSSPTFSIVNEYASAHGSLFHFDFYRLKHEHEAFDLGYEEYFYSGNYCFIEWPEKINNLLPSHYLKIEIQAAENKTRIIKIEKH